MSLLHRQLRIGNLVVHCCISNDHNKDLGLSVAEAHVTHKSGCIGLRSVPITFASGNRFAEIVNVVQKAK